MALTWDDVLALGLRLPGVEESTSYGTPALKVRGKLMCRMRTDPEALALRVVDMGEREALLQGSPEVFFTIAHYDGHPYVLVRLERADRAELGELLEDVWRLRAPKRLVSEHDARALAPRQRVPPANVPQDRPERSPWDVRLSGRRARAGRAPGAPRPAP